MSSKNIIFHHPLPLIHNGDSASRIRPYQLYQAFKKMGYNIFPVVGYTKERKESISQIKKLSQKGTKFNFLYSELTTSPLPTNDPHNLPLHPMLDFSFFQWFRKEHGNVGVFYRDAHWRFPFYGKNLNFIKKQLALSLYKFEVKKLSHNIDHLFLPSKEIKAYLPKGLLDLKSIITPPGTNADPQPQKTPNKIKLLYSGAVSAPIYDIAPFIRELSLHPELHLTLCTRPDEWHDFKKRNNFSDAPNIKIIFKNHEEMTSEFESHDLFVMPIQPNPYFNMAMPMKLFDAISYNLPLLAFKGSASSRFIDEHEIGWTFKDSKDLIDGLDKISEAQLKNTYINLENLRRQSTWAQRAKTISQTLTDD